MKNLVEIMELSTQNVLEFHRRQLAQWPEAAAGFAALENVRTRQVPVGGVVFKVQHNPARIRSTAAKVDRKSVVARPCFLCGSNRPVQQMEFPAGSGYQLLVNPFPIFPVHFTIAADCHRPQLISEGGMERFADMFALASALPGLALFYNGPSCGASAPDHFHFQAVERQELPLFEWVECIPEALPFRVETAEFHNVAEAVRWFSGVCGMLSRLDVNQGEEEPRMNVLCSATGACGGKSGVRVIVIPRRAHRPDFYGDGGNQVLLSPASVDLSGVLVAPSETDFTGKITTELIRELLRQTCFVESL